MAKKETLMTWENFDSKNYGVLSLEKVIGRDDNDSLVKDKWCSFDWTTLEDDIIHQLTWHGLKQKLADSAAGSKSFEGKFEAIESTWDMLVSGDFTKRRKAASKGHTENQMVRTAIKNGGTLEQINQLFALAGLSEIDQEAFDEIKESIG